MGVEWGGVGWVVEGIERAHAAPPLWHSTALRTDLAGLNELMQRLRLLLETDRTQLPLLELKCGLLLLRHEGTAHGRMALHPSSTPAPHRPLHSHASSTKKEAHEESVEKSVEKSMEESVEESVEERRA